MNWTSKFKFSFRGLEKRGGGDNCTEPRWTLWGCYSLTLHARVIKCIVCRSGYELNNLMKCQVGINLNNLLLHLTIKYRAMCYLLRASIANMWLKKNWHKMFFYSSVKYIYFFFLKIFFFDIFTLKNIY